MSNQFPDSPDPTIPSPEELRAARQKLNLTQKQAGAVIGYTLRGWQDLEYGNRRMHPTLWWAWRVRVLLNDPSTSLADVRSERT